LCGDRRRGVTGEELSTPAGVTDQWKYHKKEMSKNSTKGVSKQEDHYTSNPMFQREKNRLNKKWMTGTPLEEKGSNQEPEGPKPSGARRRGEKKH